MNIMDEALRVSVAQVAEEVFNLRFMADDKIHFADQPEAIQEGMCDLVVDVLYGLADRGWAVAKWADPNETVEKKDQN